ncbi:UNVERIFIED_CONTAM: hypothetical protein Slati_2133700 [Sesamum latifolium]|uniref:Integrase zinc-binding domain-containing protein n=1 Tax=Sesamum latifolium TaxID=2727402 RepID=A0AAW2WRR6_9LAMI
MTDALSRKTRWLLGHMLVKQLESIDIEVVESTDRTTTMLKVQPSILNRICAAQYSDMELEKIKNKVEAGSSSDFCIKNDGSLYMTRRLCVPSDSDLKGDIMSEAHRSRFSIHLGSTKMYRDLKENFWWNGMKRDIVEYVSKCITCQKVKAKHQKPGSWLQPLEIPEWK